MTYRTITLTCKQIEDCRKLDAFYTGRDLERGRRARVLQRFGQVMAVVAYVAETDRQGLWPVNLSRFDALLAKMWPCQREFVAKPAPMLAWIRR